MRPDASEVDADRIPVLYLGGIGRSGSTVLGRLLGSIPGVASLGEVVHLWSRGHHDDQLCGCGKPFSQCAFWREVGEHAFGSWSRVPAQEMMHLQQAVDRNRYLLWLTSGRGPRNYKADLAEYSSILASLYRAAHHVSGGAVLVDTSKNVPYAWLLRRVANLDLKVVHLVRDSRGVAYSWGKTTVVRPELTQQPGYMEAVPPTKLSARWLFDNAMFEALGTAGTDVLRVRYEDVVARPDACLRQIAGLFGVEPGQPLLAELREGSFSPVVQHEVSGNPVRFGAGPLTLRPDVEWCAQMPTADRRLVTALTAPLLTRYGYLRVGGGGADKAADSPSDR